MFVDNAEALDLVGPDTLVILVDHNTIERAQFSDVARKVETVALIDHHRKIEKMPESVRISYIEPSASSTCELVAEMLENAISSQNLIKSVADMLLSGILLDTKQFTRNTGTRTFGAAQYLRGAGASPTDVYNLFKTPPQDLSKEAHFHTSINIYKDNIAISACDGDTDESYRVIASKAADKMLTLRGIDAAFTLVKIGEQIHISGRSNGKINVQLILEKLHGGGHFDVAGAQVVSDSVTAVLETLKASIDNYLDEQ
jgi:c-di-AMP phosphodiesterase-like protein